MCLRFFIHISHPLFIGTRLSLDICFIFYFFFFVTEQIFVRSKIKNPSTPRESNEIL